LGSASTIEDALLLRGSCDFDTLEAYRRFIDGVVGRAAMQAHPAAKT
jgi:hypothetical protein